MFLAASSRRSRRRATVSRNVSWNDDEMAKLWSFLKSPLMRDNTMIVFPTEITLTWLREREGKLLHLITRHHAHLVKEEDDEKKNV